MEKELEVREKKLSAMKPPAVAEAEEALAAIKSLEAWESEAKMMQLQGEPAPPIESFVKKGVGTLNDYLQERQECIDRLREIETQVRGCQVLAEETKERIYAGDQYVNYSHITLKAGGPRAGLNKSGKGYGVELEERINATVLRIPECGECKVRNSCLSLSTTIAVVVFLFMLTQEYLPLHFFQFCLDPNTRKMCAKRREVRRELIEEEMIRVPAVAPADLDTKGTKSSGSSKPAKERKKPGRKKGWNLALTGETSPENKKPAKKGASIGSKPMALPERLLPEFARLISANGTNQRMEVINGFCRDHRETSARQATIKFIDLTTKDKPSCIAPPPKKGGKGRAVWFYLRPRFYHMLPEEERPEGWEIEAQADEVLWQQEQEEAAKAKAETEQKIRAMMADKSGESDGEGQSSVTSLTGTSITGTGNDSDDGERPMKKQKTEQTTEKKQKTEKLKTPVKPTLPFGVTDHTFPCPEIGEGWAQQIVMRPSGTIDRYYINPAGGKKFRSFAEGTFMCVLELSLDVPFALETNLNLDQLSAPLFEWSNIS